MGLQSVRRCKVVRTTISDGKAPCPWDRVNRVFKADRPNQLWVSDFTYASTWQYVAFVIDVYARCIMGWRVSSSMRTDFVLDALEQALYATQPERDGSPVCQSDRGLQGGSTGRRNTWLYKVVVIHRHSWSTRESVELAKPSDGRHGSTTTGFSGRQHYLPAKRALRFS